MGFHHGLSGLNASNKNLDVIGHNISNSNTVGFKSSRAEFNEMVASAMGASSTNNTGIGVSVSAVSQQFTQGVITPSSNGLDMAINGDGFFVVNTPSGTAFTRNGAFQLNKAGEMVTVNGDKVQGYKVDASTDTRSSVVLSDLVFPTGAPIEAKPTSQVTATLNLDATEETATANTSRALFGTSLEVFDSQGMATPLAMYFTKADGNTWNVYSNINAAEQPDPVARLEFGPTGRISRATEPELAVDDTGNPVLDNDGNRFYKEIDIKALKFTVKATNPNATPGVNPVQNITVDVDLSGVSQLGSKFSVAKLTQDGYASGELTAVNVGSDGTLMATYSNGITRAEAQVALAKFTNTQGLVPDGNNNWVSSNDSGPAVYGAAGSGSFGTIIGSALEESNVDLTAQLVNMMTAQRAYQANAQTIKTQDQIFSTLVNLR